MKAPFPWFGYMECSGQAQLNGCLPTIFPRLLRVLHRISLRFAIKAAIPLDENSGRCSFKWSRLLLSSRFSIESFSLSLSLWWTPKPSGIGPFCDSHTCCARSTQTLGSAILMKARCSLFLLCLVRILTAPMGNLLLSGMPLVNLPCMSLITDILQFNYAGGNLWTL
jgi:hypothetical protein